ncbi:hypothetical protein [Actinocorallia sp. A-T 12471]|uniref:hypothetical protein n=1 Tax=Actinocorallia sp. A-T 12471 TaxID=3089813 RepID=UPI0029CE5698|nr:hypothetical protein [Actinocorallia sp. A-T 12471]MDX6740575.1 hypothetical protein [Actinocorallia sp. A-T 12471]
MSVVGLNRLARDLEHTPDLLAAYTAAPEDVLTDYPLTADEGAAVLQRDATWLLGHGMNPVALRNLMVVLGVGHHEMYASRDGS